MNKTFEISQVAPGTFLTLELTEEWAIIKMGDKEMVLSHPEIQSIASLYNIFKDEVGQ